MHTIPSWQPYVAEQIPLPWRDYLGVVGSLTEALDKAGGDRCYVTIQQEGYGATQPDEQAILNLTSYIAAPWIREITLSQSTTGPLVYARSVFPSALVNQHQAFCQLGTQVLAKLLFSNPTIKRGTIEVALLQQDNWLFQHILNKKFITIQQTVWARRSLFYLDDQCLLVCEVMLDAIKQLS